MELLELTDDEAVEDACALLVMHLFTTVLLRARLLSSSVDDLKKLKAGPYSTFSSDGGNS